jgi:hypothetical protein
VQPAGGGLLAAGAPPQAEVVAVFSFFREVFRCGWLRQQVVRAFMHSCCSASDSGGVFWRQMIW